MADWGDIITAGGQVINDLFQSEGSTAEANSFNSAAQLAQQNAALSATSTKIQETQTARQVFQTEGTQMADVGSAGFTESGSALDLLRSSAQQGALAKSLVNIQGAINENSYAAQAGAYQGAAEAANESATGNTIGAIASLGGALVNGSQNLVSAGKSVVKGIGSIFSGSSDSASLDSVSNALDPGGLVGGETNALDVTGGSSLDDAISGGADLSQQIAASDIGLDTSAIPLGTDAGSVGEGLSNAFSNISDSVASSLGGDIAADSAAGASEAAAEGAADSLGGEAAADAAGDFAADGLLDSAADFIPVVGWVAAASQILDMIPGWEQVPVLGDITQGISDVMGYITTGVEDVVSDVGDVIGDAFGAVGDAVGGIFGSVICTAYYKLGYIRYRTWIGDQAYGAQCDPVIFRGYYRWGKPLADAITEFPLLARCLFPVFKPAINEMASIMGVGQSTLTGKLSLKAFLAISHIIGKMLPNEREVRHALKS